MKLQKSLIQAIVLGVTLGTYTASCDLVESSVQPEANQEQPAANPENGSSERQTENQPGGTCGQPEGNGTYENCAACGMG
jgi:hypothetical protein